MIQPARKSLWDRVFEPPTIHDMAPATKIVVYGLLLLWTVFVLFPIYWVLVTSFKLPIHVNNGPVYMPFVDFKPSLHAWKALFVTDWKDTFKAFSNSVIIALAATALSVLIGSMAAYALARIEYRPKFGTIMLFVLSMLAALAAIYFGGVNLWLSLAVAFAIFVLLARALNWRFRLVLGNGDILFWMISQRILAPVVVVVPIYMMFQQVGLLDTRTAIVLTYAVVNLPIVIWLMYDFFRTIPIDLEESAQLDGATRIMTFIDIVLPLSKTGLAATTLLVMILSWNEYLIALFLSTTKAQTMPILVSAMNAGERGILWWTMCVVIVVMIVPVVLMAVFLQKFIAKGLMTGAVKG